MLVGIGIGVGYLRDGLGAGVSGGTAPTITGTPLLTDNAIDVTGDLPMTFHYTNTASATPPSAATIKAAPDSRSISGGANYLAALTQETTPGTWYMHYLVANAAGDSAVQTESYVIAAPAITYVGGKTWTTTGTTGNSTISLTDLTGGLAAAPAADDFVVVAYTAATDSAVNVDMTVTGYTEAVDAYELDFFCTNLGVFYKKMPGTPDTSVEVGPTTIVGYGGAVVIQVWRGVNTTTPLDVATPTPTTGNSVSSNPDAPAITPSTSGAIILVIGGGAQNDTTGPYVASELSNFRTAQATAIVDALCGMGSFAWTSGAFNPAAWTGGQANGNNSWIGATMALRPA